MLHTLLDITIYSNKIIKINKYLDCLDCSYSLYPSRAKWHDVDKKGATVNKFY